MKNFKRYLLIIFAFISIGIQAQEQTEYHIKGSIGDTSGKTIPMVNVSIYTKDDLSYPEQEINADAEGNFDLILENSGEYILKIVEFGYEPISKEITVTDKNIDLSQIKLKPIANQTIQLQAAEIRGETSVYRTEIDKRVVEVGKDLISAGQDAASVLNNVPSLSVDQQSGELSLRGNENVKVYVDGKPSNVPTAQLLKQLPSNSIQKVEIITNPSAKYDPEGNSGIINIVTNKIKLKGYNATINTGVEQGLNTRHNSSIDVNYNTGKLNLFANYSANLGKRENSGFMNNKTSGLDQTFVMLDDSQDQLAKFGFDWFINDKTALTIYTNQMFSHSTNDSNFDVIDNNVNTIFPNGTFLRSLYHNQDYSLNFKRDFNKEDHYIQLDGLYSTSKNDDKRDFTNTYPVDLYRENREEKYKTLRLNLDYTNQIKDAGKIEAGVQFKQEKNDKDFDSSQEVMSPENITYNPLANFEFTRDIYSAYLNYGQKFGKFAAQLGLRAESVKEKIDYFAEPEGNGVYKNDYTELYPSAFFTYDITEKGQISLNYSRRIDRPWVGQLAPIPDWSTSLMISRGNPNLKPQFTNSYELGYLQKFKAGSVSANVFYRRVNDMIFRSMLLDDVNPNITIQQFTNYDHSDAYGFEFNANLKPTKWWSFNASFNIFSNTIISDGEEVKSTPWRSSMNHTFKVTKNFSIQNFYMFNGKFKFIQGEMKEMFRSDLGFRYSFFENKASFNLRFSDIFNTFKFKPEINNPYEGNGQFKWEARNVYLGFTYSFGGNVKSRKDVQQNQSENQSGGSIGF